MAEEDRDTKLQQAVYSFQGDEYLLIYVPHSLYSLSTSFIISFFNLDDSVVAKCIFCANGIRLGKV